MAEREDCISGILKSIKDRRDRKYVQDHLDELDNRASADSSGSYREALGRAAEEMLKETAVQSAIRRRNMQMDALKLRDLRSFVEHAAALEGGSYPLGIEARLVGVNRQFFDPKSRRGNQDSAAAIGLGAQRDWIGGAVLDMERAGRDDPALQGLDRLFYSKALDREWAIERYELTLGDRGRPGRTGNAQALAIAKILQKWDRTRVDALNAEGAWISDYAGYVTKTFHDPDRLRKAAGGGFRKGFEQRDRMQWASDTLNWIDAKRTFGTTVDADKKLAEMYGGLVDGSHLEIATVADGPIIPNVAGKVSASRELHFKDAESWLAYNEKYGRFNPTDGWLHNMRTSANHYGLMKVFGSRPKENFEQIVAYAKNKTMGTAAREDLNKAAPEGDAGGWLRNRYGAVSGESDRPVASIWSGLLNGVLSVQRLSKLGLTPFAMLADNATISRELGRQGMGYMDRHASMITGYFQGAEGTAKAEVADLLHAGILGRLRGVTARFDISDARAGAMAWLENKFFKITGITAMTENKRADSERMMAYWMGRQRGKAFEALGGEETRTLQSFGIGDKEWALLHKADWHALEGDTYLTPDVATKLSDADVMAYISDGRSIAERAQAAAGVTAEARASAQADMIERTRRDLAMKLWAYFGERGQNAVLEVGAKEKAILYQGTRPGQPLNTALRLVLQFKQFPTAMITRAWGAEVHGGASTMGKVAGIAELVVASTVYGMMANYLNQTAKGQDPNSQWRNNPVNALIAGFTRGGGASIYGDFLAGEYSRHGLTLLDTLAGPTFGQTNSIAEIWSDLTHLKKGAATAALASRVARNNTPFGNMIYTKAAIDYLIFYRFQEWLNPGYLERMERTMKDKQGIEFMLRPTQVSR